VKLDWVTKQHTVPVVYGQLSAAKQLQPLGSQLAGQGLQHPDFDRLVRRDLHAADGIGAFKGGGCWPTSSQ
jgi:hypothetical protein